MKRTSEITISIILIGIAVTAVLHNGNDKQPMAEYCAEEMITREVINGRLVENHHCASWVGWPIQVVEVAP